MENNEKQWKSEDESIDWDLKCESESNSYLSLTSKSEIRAGGKE